MEYYIGVDGNEHPMPAGVTLDDIAKGCLKGLCDKFGVSMPHLEHVKPLMMHVVDVNGKKIIVVDPKLIGRP